MASEEGQRVITNTSAEYPLRKGMESNRGLPFSELQPPKVTPADLGNAEEALNWNGRWLELMNPSLSVAGFTPSQTPVDLAATCAAAGWPEPAAALAYVGLKAWQAGWTEAVHLLWRPYVFGLLRNTLALMVGVTLTCGVTACPWPGCWNAATCQGGASGV